MATHGPTTAVNALWFRTTGEKAPPSTSRPGTSCNSSESASDAEPSELSQVKNSGSARIWMDNVSKSRQEICIESASRRVFKPGNCDKKSTRRVPSPRAAQRRLRSGTAAQWRAGCRACIGGGPLRAGRRSRLGDAEG
ncbi:hypothetical protein C8R44DRAFT_739447 [Mycena epipterygia]|nr:hypothetical protein C8R44DRAFT_739447 [Mycena epipterygia]